jgi:hypothetical protein
MNVTIGCDGLAYVIASVLFVVAICIASTDGASESFIVTYPFRNTTSQELKQVGIFKAV